MIDYGRKYDIRVLRPDGLVEIKSLSIAEVLDCPKGVDTSGVIEIFADVENQRRVLDLNNKFQTELTLGMAFMAMACVLVLFRNEVDLISGANLVFAFISMANAMRYLWKWSKESLR